MKVIVAKLLLQDIFLKIKLRKFIQNAQHQKKLLSPPL